MAQKTVGGQVSRAARSARVMHVLVADGMQDVGVGGGSLITSGP